MAVEEWDRAWTRLSDYRGVNANMHGVEAMLAAADALEPEDPVVAWDLRAQALRTTERVVHGWAREADWRLPEHFTADWTPLPDYNRDEPAHPFRPFGVTVGHQFEWARLALQLRAVLPDPPGWLLDDGVALFDAAATRGWAADGHDGFPYTLDWTDRPVVGARMHWVLCEAVAAAGVVGEVTGEQRYRDLARGRELVVPAAGDGVGEAFLAVGPPAPREVEVPRLAGDRRQHGGGRDRLAEDPVHAGADHRPVVPVEGVREAAVTIGRPAPRHGRVEQRERVVQQPAGRSGRDRAEVQGQPGPLELVPDGDPVRAERVGRLVAVVLGQRRPVAGEVLGKPPGALAGPPERPLGGAQRLGAQPARGLLVSGRVRSGQ